MVIYFDIVLLVNIIMNFIILCFVALTLNLEKNMYRILIGSILGCLFLLEILSDKFNFLNTFTSKVILSTLMIFISFRPNSLKEFIKVQGFFYLISFMVGGGVLAFFYFFNMNQNYISNIFLLNNISIPWWILLVSSLILFIFLKYVWPLIYRILSKEELLVPVSICFNDKNVNLQAFIDTGNDLYDPISCYPVIIVEHEIFKNLFPEKLEMLFETESNEILSNIPNVLVNSKWANRFRIIPFESIGKSKGLMVGFLPDLVTIKFNHKTLKTKNVIIGIYRKQLSSEGIYKALLNPDLLTE